MSETKEEFEAAIDQMEQLTLHLTPKEIDRTKILLTRVADRRWKRARNEWLASLCKGQDVRAGHFLLSKEVYIEMNTLATIQWLGRKTADPGDRKADIIFREKGKPGYGVAVRIRCSELRPETAEVSEETRRANAELFGRLEKVFRQDGK